MITLFHDERHRIHGFRPLFRMLQKQFDRFLGFVVDDVMIFIDIFAREGQGVAVEEHVVNWVEGGSDGLGLDYHPLLESERKESALIQ